jgi:DNA-binding NtrC family response regulator
MAKILIVEKEEALRRLYNEELEEHGHWVHTIEFHDQALEKIRDLEPDIIMFGIRPRGYDWPKLLMDVRQNFPKLLIIFNTSEVSLWERAINLGATACYEKSSDLNPLLATIKELMAKK